MGHALGHPPNPFATVDKGSVIGILQATGSRDPDVLYARKTELFSPIRVAKLAGVLLIIAGLLLCLRMRGVFVGVPLIALGWWVRHRAVRNLATIEDGFREYVRTPAA